MTKGVGWCGLDRKRLPLRGDELRGCWDGGVARAEPQPSPGTARPPAPTARTFVPVGPDAEPPSPTLPVVMPVERRAQGEAWTERRTLFGDAEA